MLYAYSTDNERPLHKLQYSDSYEIYFGAHVFVWTRQSASISSAALKKLASK